MNKTQLYEKYIHNTKGFVAQGSEVGFGKMYARGINDEALNEQKDTFVIDRLRGNDRVALTHKRASNAVFFFGRDHGHFGRILNQTVVAQATIEVVGGREVFGWCFTPQDGNSLLSSVSVTEFLLFPT